MQSSRSPCGERDGDLEFTQALQWGLACTCHGVSEVRRVLDRSAGLTGADSSKRGWIARVSRTVQVCGCGWLLLWAGGGKPATSVTSVIESTRVAVLGSGRGVGTWANFRHRESKSEWPPTTDSGGLPVSVINDGPSVHHGISEGDLAGLSLARKMLEPVLTAGVREDSRTGSGVALGRCGMGGPPWCKWLPSRDYLHKAWELAGRAWLTKYSGVRWNNEARKWQIDLRWPYGEFEVAPLAYNIEFAARGAVELALVSHDLGLLNELAGFYLAYVNRFTTLGTLRRRESLFVSTQLLDNQGLDSAKTLPWLEKGVLRSRLRECLLCNGQFFHPAARLIRVISTLPESERTQEMTEFVRTYLPLILRDHLLRLAYMAQWGHLGTDGSANQLIDIWRSTIRASIPPRPSYQYAMTDLDLWLIGTAAEILGGNANEPELISLSREELVGLREIVQVGIELFQRKRMVYKDTRDFRGRVVESASYFNGDLDDHPDMAYAAYSGKLFPSLSQKQPARYGSWDISHFYRVPIFLRSLYDNRSATGSTFPRSHDIELVINQYVYRVFQGDFSRPLFRNFFDGRDGWYRTGYHGSGFGYPPSQYCDMGSTRRPCLTVAGVYGWGLIAFLHADLTELQHALIRLALSRDPPIVHFRDQYYKYNNEPFSFVDAQGSLQYPFLLFALLSDLSGQIVGNVR